MSLEDRRKRFLERTKKERPDIIVLGEYKGSNQKILVRGSECEHEWDTTPNNIRIGVGCPKCFNKRLSKKLTYSDDEFKKKVKGINPDYEPVDEYTKSIDYMTFRCKKHDHEWKMRAGHIKKDSCKICKMDKKKQRIKDEILKKNPTIELLSEYVDCNTPMKYKCSIDGHESEAKSLVLKTGNVVCEQCKRRKYDEQLLNELLELEPDIEFLDDFQGMDELITFKFKGSEKVFEDYPSNILKNAKRKAKREK